MNRAKSLLSSLRGAGVSIRAVDGRLVVEAPAGAISKDARDRLVQSKAELLEALRAEDAPEIDDAVIQAGAEIVDVLTAAYARFAAVPRVADPPQKASKDPVAKRPDQSVHGVVQ
jgi:hypothetical protein